MEALLTDVASAVTEARTMDCIAVHAESAEDVVVLCNKVRCKDNERRSDRACTDEGTENMNITGNDQQGAHSSGRCGLQGYGQ